MQSFEYKGFYVTRKMWRDRWSVGVYWPAVSKATSYTFTTEESVKTRLDEFIEKGGVPVSEIHREYSHLHWGVMEMFDANKETHRLNDEVCNFVWDYMLKASSVTDELLMSYENLAMMMCFWERIYPDKPILMEIK